MTNEQRMALPGGSSPENTLLIVIGNDSRGDDGLGWAFGKALEARGWPGQVEYRYQLQVEDAELLASFGSVVFVDAWLGDQESFRLEKCLPTGHPGFTTHRLEPAAVLALCRDIFGHVPEAALLLIAGENWDLGNGLSDRGKTNLGRALQAFYSAVVPYLAPQS